MSTFGPHARAFAGLLILAGAGCAHQQQESSTTPAAAAVQTPQRQSQRALDRAREAQQRAADQERKAIAAQQEVQRLHQQLLRAQDHARQEQAKARQLQEQANLATRDATQQAERSQQQASRALAEQGRQLDRGELTVTGHVTHATADQLVVQPQSGGPMTFHVGSATRVLIDGHGANAADIQQGQDALVAYDVAGEQPTAKLVQIRTGRTGGAQEQGTGSGNPAPRGSAPEQR